MNAPQAYSRPVIGGHHAMARFVHKAEAVVLCKGGKPLIFKTAKDARIAALEAVLAHMVSTITGSGERVSAARCKAETLFKRKGCHAEA